MNKKVIFRKIIAWLIFIAIGYGLCSVLYYILFGIIGYISENGLKSIVDSIWVGNK